jgi:hypothetical protein
MTCYFRHLVGAFAKAGLAVTPENKREVDRLIHELVEVEYKACPAAWRAVKAKLQEDEDALAELLRTKVKPKLGRGGASAGASRRGSRTR